MTAAPVHDRAPSFVHQAFFYAGEDEFVDAMTAFVRAGLAAGEPCLVVVSARKIERLREALGDDAGRVLFADMDSVGANPARIIPAWHRFVEEHGAKGTAVRGIGEPIFPERSSHELVECERHEALLNLAFAEASPFTLLCPYDTDALDPGVIAEARRNHPIVVDRAGIAASADYRGLDSIAAPFAESLPPPPADAAELQLGPETIAAARGAISAAAADAGLSAARIHDAVVVVSELATNTVRHGGGRGLLRVWHEDSTLVFEVSDGGRIVDPLVGRKLPGADSVGGRGLWMANHLCDLVQVRTYDTGSAVRVRMRVR